MIRFSAQIDLPANLFRRQKHTEIQALSLADFFSPFPVRQPGIQFVQIFISGIIIIIHIIQFQIPLKAGIRAETFEILFMCRWQPTLIIGIQ